eukprot:213022-Rhodomonas_salina.1
MRGGMSVGLISSARRTRYARAYVDANGSAIPRSMNAMRRSVVSNSPYPYRNCVLRAVSGLDAARGIVQADHGCV